MAKMKIIEAVGNNQLESAVNQFLQEVGDIEIVSSNYFFYTGQKTHMHMNGEPIAGVVIFYK